MGSNEQIYVLVLQLPLRGALKSGGLVYVLKATANQADKCVRAFPSVDDHRGSRWPCRAALAR